MYTDQNGDILVKKLTKHIILGVLSLFVLIVIFGSFGTIQVGERGIKTRLGAMVGIVNPGLYFTIPFVEKVTKMNIQTTNVIYEKENPLTAASSDLQDVKIAVVMSYHVDPTKVDVIFQKYGDTSIFEEKVIRPAVRDTVKAVASQFSAEELVTKRPEFTDKALNLLSERLVPQNVSVERVNITNFEFSASFTAAIEAKVTAVQNAEAAKNKLEQIKFEAQQTVEKAKAEAEAIRIQAQAINSQGGADYVALQKIQKWDGHGCTTYCGLETSTGLLINSK